MITMDKVEPRLGSKPGEQRVFEIMGCIPTHMRHFEARMIAEPHHLGVEHTKATGRILLAEGAHQLHA